MSLKFKDMDGIVYSLCYVNFLKKEIFPPTNIIINNTEPIELYSTQTIQLSVTVLPEYAEQDTIWSVESGEDCASVDINGLVTINNVTTDTTAIIKVTSAVKEEIFDTITLNLKADNYLYKLEAETFNGLTDGEDTGLTLFDDEHTNWTIFSYTQNSENPNADKNATLYQLVVSASPWTGLRIDANNNSAKNTETVPAPLRPRFTAGTDVYFRCDTGETCISSFNEDAATAKIPFCFSRDGNIYKWSFDGQTWTTFENISQTQIARLKNLALTVGFDYKRSSGVITDTKYRFLKTNHPICVAIIEESEYPYYALYSKYKNDGSL